MHRFDFLQHPPADLIAGTRTRKRSGAIEFHPRRGGRENPGNDQELPQYELAGSDPSGEAGPQRESQQHTESEIPVFVHGAARGLGAWLYGISRRSLASEAHAQRVVRRVYAHQGIFLGTGSFFIRLTARRAISVTLGGKGEWPGYVCRGLRADSRESPLDRKLPAGADLVDNIFPRAGLDRFVPPTRSFASIRTFCRPCPNFGWKEKP